MNFINLSNEQKQPKLKIIDIAKRVEEFSHETNTTIDLDEWLHIFNLKKIYHLSIDQDKCEYVINYGQLRIKYYHFVIENLNLYDNAKIIAFYPRSRNQEKINKFQKYYEYRKKFINQFLKK